MVKNIAEIRQRLSQYPDALTAEETAELLRVNVKTVYKLIRNNELPAVKVGRSFRVSKTELIHYIGGERISSNPKCVLSDNSSNPVWTSHQSCDIVPVANGRNKTERSIVKCRVKQILQQASRQKKDGYTL